MATATSGTAHEVRLAELPAGLPERRHFQVVEAPVPAPGPGEVLVRNRHFLVFAALRTLLGGGVRDAPLPPLRPGDTLLGHAVGEVVAAGEGAGLPAGTPVTHMLGWREYAVLPAGQAVRLDGQAALPEPAQYLNQGATAYGALTRLGQVREGDTVLVTGAAGGVGTLAGQIARRLGAARVIGTTGSAAKAERLVSELGYDTAVLRGQGPGAFARELARAAPDGVDVLLDNVGGEQLAAAVGAARQGARFALVGALSGQLDPAGDGAGAPVTVDSTPLILKGVALRGYSGLTHQDVVPEWTARFGEWLRAGAIRFPHTRVAGIERAPEALEELVRGRHFGTVIVDV
jgi:NADPH-dependent curcumin reductase CurA